MICPRAALALACCMSSCTPPSSPARDATTPFDDGGDGYDAQPGAGACFFLDRFVLSEPGAGLDLTGDGAPDTRFNDAFDHERPFFDSLFANTIETGQFLSVVEVAGLPEPYAGEDDAATIKLYPCDDADDDVSNNACREPGCGRMVADAEFLQGGQPLYRTAPGPVSGYRTRGELGWTLVIVLSDAPLLIPRTTFDLHVPAARDELAGSIMCGAARTLSLDAILLCDMLPDPCPPMIPADLTMAATLRERGYQPDVDLDGDGPETFEIDPATYDVAECRDGDGTLIAGANCLRDPRMADGYSLCFDIHGLPAVLLLP